MIRSRRQPGFKVCRALPEFRNEELCECPRAVDRIVFFLARARVVECKIAEMWRRVAGHAITDRSARGRRSVVRPAEEKLHSGQFQRAEVEILLQRLEASIR